MLIVEKKSSALYSDGVSNAKNFLSTSTWNFQRSLLYTRFIDREK